MNCSQFTVAILYILLSVFTLSPFMVRSQGGQQIVSNYACHLRLARGHALMTMSVSHSLRKISVLEYLNVNYGHQLI